MKFSDDARLEALVGKVCLVFARVEQESGHVVMAAEGNWDMAMSTDYLDYSSNSGLLLDWLKEVGRAYPEVNEDIGLLRTGLKELKKQRDAWAHSAAVIDLWLMMKEKGLTTMSDGDVEHGRLLNGRSGGHIDAPNEVAVDRFIQRASDIGDTATDISRRVAELVDYGVRPLRDPKAPKRQSLCMRLKRRFNL